MLVLPWLSLPGARLFLTSATLLFVELLLIRWIPANVIHCDQVHDPSMASLFARRNDSWLAGA